MNSLLRRTILPLTLIVALAFGGCITTDQVRDIVRQSNYEMLVSADPALATIVPANPADANATKPSPSAVERLNNFLQANPDDPVLGPTLYLRQALHYLNERQFDLSEAAFKQIKGKLTTARDEALAANYPSLRWWMEWSLAGAGAFRDQRTNAVMQMKTLADAATSSDLKSSPDVADYFREIRAWIGLKAGFAIKLPDDKDFQVSTLQSAVDGWTASFAPAELALLGNAKFEPKDAFTLSTRRVLRLRSLLGRLADAAKSGGSLVPPPELHFASAEAQAYYEAKLNAR
jgi:hypothetical protein